jgi:chromosome segregation ATPase
MMKSRAEAMAMLAMAKENMESAMRERDAADERIDSLREGFVRRHSQLSNLQRARERDGLDGTPLDQMIEQVGHQFDADYTSARKEHADKKDLVERCKEKIKQMEDAIEKGNYGDVVDEPSKMND